MASAASRWGRSCRTRLCGWCSSHASRLREGNDRPFQCRTRLFPFAPTTASRSPSPARAGEAWLRAVFSQNHAILASPADAGERSTSANHTSFYSCSWDVFPYDLFPVQLCPMGLLLGQVSKWRAQRADRGAHAARGFVGGATVLRRRGRRGILVVSMPHAALWVVQRFYDERKPSWGIVSMPHAALWVVQPSLDYRRGIEEFVSMPHAALWVVQLNLLWDIDCFCWFQCRTRLCGWCNVPDQKGIGVMREVSMPHAALWVVQQGDFHYEKHDQAFQCRTRLCGWCNI